MPKSLMAELKHESSEKIMPMARLIAYAIYNELELPKPFTFETKIPSEAEVPYDEDAYTEQAMKLYGHIVKMGTGAALDILLLCKGIIGMPANTILLAYRELLKKGIIEEYSKDGRFAKYHPNYKRCRPTSMVEKKQKHMTPTEIKEMYLKPKRSPLDDVT